jgi:plasmid stabilization system protein ParE
MKRKLAATGYDDTLIFVFELVIHGNVSVVRFATIADARNENQVKRIKEKTQVLKTQPESGRIVPELEIEQIRELIEGAYRIVNRLIEKNRVEILTIHHSSRDFNSRDLNAK